MPKFRASMDSYAGRIDFKLSETERILPASLLTLHAVTDPPDSVILYDHFPDLEIFSSAPVSSVVISRDVGLSLG